VCSLAFANIGVTASYVYKILVNIGKFFIFFIRSFGAMLFAAPEFTPFEAIMYKEFVIRKRTIVKKHTKIP
jgi:hypothetical protein